MKTAYDLCPCLSGKKIKFCCISTVSNNKQKALAALTSLDLPSEYFFGYGQEGLVSAAIVRKKGTSWIVGSYLIDYYCLGIKYAEVFDDADIIFVKNYLANLKDVHAALTPLKYEHMREFIFSARDFAKSCGFDPHPDWEYAQFMLEPYQPYQKTDFEFGLEGKPFYINGPYETAKTVKAICAQVIKMGGAYQVLHDTNEFGDIIPIKSSMSTINQIGEDQL